MLLRNGNRWILLLPSLAVVLATAVDCTQVAPKKTGLVTSPRDSGRSEGGLVGDDEDGEPDPDPDPDPERDSGPDPNTSVSFPGLDYPFNDIAELTNKSEQECWASCTQNSQCVGVVVGTGTDVGRCWTKSRLALGEPGALRTSLARSTNPLAPFSKFKIGAGSGGSALSTTTADAEACARSCSDNAGCTGFVVKRGSQECALFGTVTDGAACADCVRYCAPGRGACP